MCSWKVDYFLEKFFFYVKKKILLLQRWFFWETFQDHAQKDWYFLVRTEIILDCSFSNFIPIKVAVTLQKSDRPVSIAREFWALLRVLRRIFDSLLIPNWHRKLVKVFPDYWKGRFIINIFNGIRIIETLQAGLINSNFKISQYQKIFVIPRN